MTSLVIGIDPHSRVHVAAAVDELGRCLARHEVGAAPKQLARLVEWVASMGAAKVALEGSKGYGLPLARLLLAAGHTVVDVSSNLTAEERKRSRRRGKDDEGDAVAIARVALREPDLPVMDEAHLDADLKLLVDARDQLVQEEARLRNRLHALLLVMSPGYQQITGPLNSRPAFARARSLTLRARRSDPTRARLALAHLRRLNALRDEQADLERDINAELERRRPTRLLAIPGVGPLVAAKLLGEARDVRHYASAAAFAAHAGVAPVPASSGNTQRHRLARGGNRQLNRALFTIAMVQARWHPPAREFLARKRTEGKTAAEARRCLKRHLANVVYRAMTADLHQPDDQGLAPAA
ncbi:IS110 family transposase [Aquipuribacter nitratireducens]|uniref:IS110 family transposase n=2 Tax=Aquipuribacter nitratireducens TaxID=650104 RepID=A0ABW0GQQ8_9MICO